MSATDPLVFQGLCVGCSLCLECAFHVHLYVQRSRVITPLPPKEVHALIPGTWGYNEINLESLGGPNVITWIFKSRRGSQRLKVLEGFNVPLLAWRLPGRGVPRGKCDKEMNSANISELGREPHVLDGNHIPGQHLDFSSVRRWAKNAAPLCRTSDLQSCEIIHVCCFKLLNMLQQKWSCFLLRPHHLYLCVAYSSCSVEFCWTQGWINDVFVHFTDSLRLKEGKYLIRGTSQSADPARTRTQSLDTQSQTQALWLTPCLLSSGFPKTSFI